MRFPALATLLAMTLLASGCDMIVPPADYGTSDTSADSTAVAENSTESPGEVTNSAPPSPYPTESTEFTLPDSGSPDSPEVHYAPGVGPAEPATPTETVEAQAGVGEQGQSLEPGSMITEPARALFRTQQRLVFQQVEQALQLYKATNDSVPADTDEFMEKIIKPNNLQLPKLPAGQTYLFDPESEMLMVVRPKS